MESKICAIMRQTWYETAKKNLDQADRLRFYECVFEYEFFDQLPTENAPLAVRLMFDMVRDTIDSDKAKAKNRAETARANGALGGRPAYNKTQQGEPKPSGLNENPVGFNGLPLHNTTKQNTTKNNKSLSNEDTHTFFDCCLLFFERGVKDPLAEVNLFWNYYAAKGWQISEGQPIIDRYALAKAWRPKDVSAALMKRRQDYALLLRMIGSDDISLISNFSYCNVNKTASAVTIGVTKEETAHTIDKYLDALAEWLPKDTKGQRYSLTYQVALE